MRPKSFLNILAIVLTLTFTMPLDTLGQNKEKQNGPPAWAPAHGYRAKTRHIYFPDHNFYFDLQKNVYIYLGNDTWRVGVKLPSLYASIDLGKAVKVELELNTDSPQKYNSEHIVKYKTKTKAGSIKPK